MNIFKILSSYDGKINEPNISAFLAFLMNPLEEHGLKYSLINSILEKIIEDKELKDKNINKYLKNYISYTIEVTAEFPVDVKNTVSKNNRRDIDILIEIYENKEKQEFPNIVICLENKILSSSLSDDFQLQDEALGINELYKDSKDTEKYFLLLVPEITSRIKNSFDKVENIEKSIFLWKNEKNSIIELLKSILSKERNGDIDPINLEVKFIIKSFMAFINNDFQSKTVFEVDSKKENYGKSINEYLKEIYEDLEDEKEYSIKELKEKLTNLVEKNSGKKLNTSTRNCQIYKVIVNDKSRTNYNIKNPLDEKANLFYYINEEKRDSIKKFNFNKIRENINIYYLEGKERIKRNIIDLKKEFLK